MQRVKAHNLRKLEEPKLVEELTKHRVSFMNQAQLVAVPQGLRWLLVLAARPLLISNVAFRKSSQALESARFHPSPRWSLPRLDKWERLSQRSWPCWARRESPPPELNPREKDICQKTWDWRKQDISAEDCRHSKARRRQFVLTRGYKLSNLESTLLLNEMCRGHPHALASSRSDLEIIRNPSKTPARRSSSPAGGSKGEGWTRS